MQITRWLLLLRRYLGRESRLPLGASDGGEFASRIAGIAGPSVGISRSYAGISSNSEHFAVLLLRQRQAQYALAYRGKRAGAVWARDIEITRKTARLHLLSRAASNRRRHGGNAWRRAGGMAAAPNAGRRAMAASSSYEQLSIVDIFFIISGAVLA